MGAWMCLKDLILQLCENMAIYAFLLQQQGNFITSKNLLAKVKNYNRKYSVIENEICLNEKIKEKVDEIHLKIQLLQLEISNYLFTRTFYSSFTEQQEIEIIENYYCDCVTDTDMKFKYGPMWKSKLQKMIDKCN